LGKRSSDTYLVFVACRAKIMKKMYIKKMLLKKNDLIQKKKIQKRHCQKIYLVMPFFGMLGTSEV